MGWVSLLYAVDQSVKRRGAPPAVINYPGRPSAKPSAEPIFDQHHMRLAVAFAGAGNADKVTISGN
jgi:hypothetical protein